MSALRPLMLQERRQSGHGNTSHSCQPTHAPQQTIVLTVPQSKGGDRKDLPFETRKQLSHLHPNALECCTCCARRKVRFACGRIAEGACQATSGSLPSPLGCLTNISPAGRPIESRTAQALRRRSSTSAAKPGLTQYCVRSTIMVTLVGIIVPCPSAAAGTTGRAAAPALRCRNRRRPNSIVAPSQPCHSINSSARPDRDSGIVMPSVLAVLRLMYSSTSWPAAPADQRASHP
jgi:hypothetical protein